MWPVIYKQYTKLIQLHLFRIPCTSANIILIFWHIIKSAVFHTQSLNIILWYQFQNPDPFLHTHIHFHTTNKTPNILHRAQNPDICQNSSSWKLSEEAVKKRRSFASKCFLCQQIRLEFLLNCSQDLRCNFGFYLSNSIGILCVMLWQNCKRIEAKFSLLNVNHLHIVCMFLNCNNKVIATNRSQRS